MCHHNTVFLLEWHEGQEAKLTPELQAHRNVTRYPEPLQSTQYRCTACNSLLRKPSSCFLPTFFMPDSTVCFQFNRGTNTTLSHYSMGKKPFLSARSKNTWPLVVFAKWVSILIYPQPLGCFPALVEHHCAGWECFLLIYWYLYHKVHLSAALVHSPLVSQTLWVSWVFCKRLSKDEVEQKGRGCQTLRNSRCDLCNV